MAYKSFLRCYKDQPSSEIFAHFQYNKNNEMNWESPFVRPILLPYFQQHKADKPVSRKFIMIEDHKR
jgi:hypothetical protein